MAWFKAALVGGAIFWLGTAYIVFRVPFRRATDGSPSPSPTPHPQVR